MRGGIKVLWFLLFLLIPDVLLAQSCFKGYTPNRFMQLCKIVDGSSVCSRRYEIGKYMCLQFATDFYQELKAERITSWVVHYGVPCTGNTALSEVPIGHFFNVIELERNTSQMKIGREVVTSTWSTYCAVDAAFSDKNPDYPTAMVYQCWKQRSNTGLNIPSNVAKVIDSYHSYLKKLKEDGWKLSFTYAPEGYEYCADPNNPLKAEIVPVPQASPSPTPVAPPTQ